MHTAKFLKDKKNHHIIFSYKKKIILFFIHKTQFKKNKRFYMQFGFNNKFVKAMRTKPIF